MLKMPADDPLFFGRGFFPAERDLHVAAGQAAIVRQSNPGAESRATCPSEKTKRNGSAVSKASAAR